MPFVDGEPIDASKLGAIETELNKLRAEMPKIGPSSTSIAVTQNVNNSGTAVSNTKVAPQIFGGITGEISLTPNSRKTFNINYTAAGLTSAPKAIILTPIAPTFTGSINEASIVSGSVTATSATAQIYHRSDYTPVKVRYYFMVILY